VIASSSTAGRVERGLSCLFLGFTVFVPFFLAFLLRILGLLETQVDKEGMTQNKQMVF
jgi:hypothetical protein